MEESEYRSIKGRLSGSLICDVLTNCPANVQRKIIYGIEETPAMARGTLGHAATLEKERVQDTFVVFDRKLVGDGRTGKALTYKKDGSLTVMGQNYQIKQEFIAEAEAAGKIPVMNPKEFDEIMKVAGILHSHPFWQLISQDMLIEHPMLWTADNGCECKGKADIICDTYGIIPDVKFLRDISPNEVINSVYKRMYHAQIAAYQDGYGKTSGKEGTTPMGVIIACDLNNLDIVVYGLPDKYSTAKANWAEYQQFFERESRPLWRDISIDTGKELYDRACERWQEWNNRYGRIDEMKESGNADPETGEVIMIPANPYPGWDYIAQFNPENRLKIFQL